jgi:hypothetical protein
MRRATRRNSIREVPMPRRNSLRGVPRRNSLREMPMPRRNSLREVLHLRAVRARDAQVADL